MGNVRLQNLLLAVLLGPLAGCASITGSSTQSISIEAVERTGTRVVAECRLSNDKGNWTVKTPSHVSVGRSGEDLSVQCTADGQDPGLVKVVSRANGGMVGNIVFGGVVGALVDNSGAGYDYPDLVRVVMGASLVTDKRDQASGSSPPPSPAAPPPPQAAPPPAGRATMDDLKDLLPPSQGK
jgi:hypothetical protein